jgi:hypothetical protein
VRCAVPLVLLPKQQPAPIIALVEQQNPSIKVTNSDGGQQLRRQGQLTLLLLLQVELQPGTSDEQYLSELQAALAKAAAEFPRPHLIIYNAGEQ